MTLPAWRSRPRTEGLFGPEPVEYRQTREEAEEALAAHERLGVHPILEEAHGPLWRAPSNPPLLVEELVKQGHARPHPAGGYQLDPTGRHAIMARMGLPTTPR